MAVGRLGSPRRRRAAVALSGERPEPSGTRTGGRCHEGPRRSLAVARLSFQRLWPPGTMTPLKRPPRGAWPRGPGRHFGPQKARRALRRAAPLGVTARPERRFPCIAARRHGAARTTRVELRPRRADLGRRSTGRGRRRQGHSRAKACSAAAPHARGPRQRTQRPCCCRGKTTPWQQPHGAGWRAGRGSAGNKQRRSPTAAPVAPRFAATSSRATPEGTSPRPLAVFSSGPERTGSAMWQRREGDRPAAPLLHGASGSSEARQTISPHPLRRGLGRKRHKSPKQAGPRVATS
mmetsp:Transcript_74769/g.207910  ORF Transcript_74769/g.207910 Transcript_74769/m.207910 type:complete len:292 (-) Transcript_74769:2836-3711(-)